MSDENVQQVAPVTIEQVRELINQSVAGFAAKSSKQLNEVLNPIHEQLKNFTAQKEVVTTEQTATDPKISILERQLKELQTENQAAKEKVAKADRDSALNKALSGFTFANDTARDTAYKVFSADMQTIGDGQYAIGDQPLHEAVQERMKSLTGLIAPKAVSGSGATSGSAAQNTDLQFKPNMTMEDYQRIATEALKQL
jgi:hypothetical protein